jgi:DNA-binding response OmpR family regulator
MKVLVIEDERELRRSVLEYMHNAGFVCESAADYESGLEKIDLYDYDCVVLDINLPGGSGLDLLRILKRKKRNTGVLILSANDALNDRVEGLELGADDYLTKPFHLSELQARIKSILRRRKSAGSDSLIVLEEITINTDSNRVFVHDQEIVLTRKEYDLLLYLMMNKGRVVTKMSISEHLWGDFMDQSDSHGFIYSHVKNLRKKLLDKGCKDYLKTIYGVGYNFRVQ